ncbi:MAG: copper ion binding protein, partial [Magnetospirillum sp.]|nr:copper ion binding protein [Magnetospirillum sp.]
MTHFAASISLPIKGMTCAACSTRLERVLGKVDGVQAASVSLAAERADLSFDPARTGPQQLAEVVAKAGFSVPEDVLELSISGMTCAACSTRLEKVLGKLAGVGKAEVNLATERARVTVLPGTASAADLVIAVQKAGFGAQIVTDSHDQATREEQAHARDLRHQLIR